MKPALYLITAFFSIVISCNKQQEQTGPVLENIGMYGKWRLSEIFYGYVMGGDFKWHQVPPAHSDSFEFGINGDFKRVGNAGQGYPVVCTGTYQLLSNMIQFYATCYQPYQPGWIKISESTNSTLIFDVQVIEGVIRHKYKPEK